MTQEEMAAFLDMSARNLRDVLKVLGMPSKGFDPDAVRVAYIRMLRDRAVRANGRPQENDTAQERHLLTKARRAKAELELGRLKGSLLDAEDVKREVFEMARRTRDRILGIPYRVAASLAAETDAKAIERLLDDELRTALEELSR
ncbi:MAG: hypothetical protein HQL96_01665 [Magnetococcales bacterium]|nr:hypothetical protein [Magnetococcales bacterium]